MHGCTHMHVHTDTITTYRSCLNAQLTCLALKLKPLFCKDDVIMYLSGETKHKASQNMLTTRKNYHTKLLPSYRLLLHGPLHHLLRSNDSDITNTDKYYSNYNSLVQRVETLDMYRSVRRSYPYLSFIFKASGSVFVFCIELAFYIPHNYNQNR